MSRMASFALSGPWFRRHPRAAALVALALIVAVTWLRFAHGDETDATTLLYALPVTLVAMTFGRRFGLAVAGVCAVLLTTWVLVADVTLSATGWIARGVPLLLLGGLIGSATDALDAARETEVALAIATARQRDAAEVQDEIIQRLAAAKWQVEGLGGDSAAALLEDAIVAGQTLVQSLMTGSDDPLVSRRSDDRPHPASAPPS